MAEHPDDNDPFEEDIVFDQAGLLGGKMPRSRQQSTVGFLPTFMLFIRTVFLCIAFVGLGLCVSVSGGPLIRLEVGVGTPVDTAFHTFTARSVGTLLGGVLGSLLFEVYNRQFLMFVSLVWVAASVTVLPFTVATSLAWTFATTAALGMGLGFLFTGGNVLCLDLWGRTGGASLQALHFSFAVGAFIAPLVVHPFFIGLHPIELHNHSLMDDFATTESSELARFIRGLDDGVLNNTNIGLGTAIGLSSEQWKHLTEPQVQRDNLTAGNDSDLLVTVTLSENSSLVNEEVTEPLPVTTIVSTKPPKKKPSYTDGNNLKADTETKWKKQQKDSGTVKVSTGTDPSPKVNNSESVSKNESSKVSTEEPDNKTTIASDNVTKAPIIPTTVQDGENEQTTNATTIPTTLPKELSTQPVPVTVQHTSTTTTTTTIPATITTTTAATTTTTTTTTTTVKPTTAKINTTSKPSITTVPTTTKPKNTDDTIGMLNDSQDITEKVSVQSSESSTKDVEKHPLETNMSHEEEKASQEEETHTVEGESSPQEDPSQQEVESSTEKQFELEVDMEEAHESIPEPEVQSLEEPLSDELEKPDSAEEENDEDGDSPSVTLSQKPGTYFNGSDDSSQFFEDMAKRFKEYGVTKVHLAYICIGIFIILNALISVVILCHNPREPRSKQDDGSMSEINKSRVVIFTVVFSFFMFMSEALQGAVHHLLASSSTGTGLKIIQNTGIDGQALFWGLVCLVRFLCILVSGCLRLKPGKLLLISVLFSAIGSVFLAIGSYGKADFLWSGIIFMALGLAPILPTSLLWMAQYMRVTHRMCALMIVLASFGNSITHSLLTKVVGNSHIYAFILVIVSFFSLFCLFVSMCVIYTARRSRTLGVPAGYQLASQHEEEESIELTPSGSAVFSPSDPPIRENGEAGQSLLID